MVSTPASASAMNRTATQRKPTLLTLPAEIRTIIWKLSQPSSNSRSLEMTDCAMIKQRSVCNDSCENDSAHWFSLSEILFMPLCPLLLVNHQTRSETLPLGKPRRTIHYCVYGWEKQLLYALTVAQRSLVNQIRVTVTFNEHHTMDKAQQPVIAERWLAFLKEGLREYYEQVEIIGWTCTEEENVLPQDICTVPDWQVLRMELGVEKARETKLTSSELRAGEKKDGTG